MSPNSQPFLVKEVFHLSKQLCGSFDLLQQVNVVLALRPPELDTELQVGSHQSGVEKQNPLPLPASHSGFAAVQDMFGFLGWECTLLGRVQPLIQQQTQVLGRTALNLFIPQSVLLDIVAAFCTWPY